MFLRHLALLGALLIGQAHAATTPTVSAVNTEGFYGSRNLLKNAGFEPRIGKVFWTASGGTFSTTTTAANVGRGSQSATWDSNSASQTLCSSALAIPAGLYGRNGEVSANLQCSSGTCTHTISVYDGSSTIQSQTITSSTNYTRSTLNFIFPTSGNIQMCLTSVASDEPQLNIDDGYLGEARNLTNTVITTPWSNSLTWTVNGYGTNTSQNIYWRRVGDTMEVRGSWVNGTVAASTAYIQLPSAYTIDTNKLPSNSSGTVVGILEQMNTSSNDVFAPAIGQMLFYDGSTNNQVFIAGYSSTNFTKNNGSSLSSTGNKQTFQMVIPISGWETQTAYTADTYAFSWSGYHAQDCSWARTNTSYGDPTADSTCTFTERTNRNAGTVTSYLSGSDKLPGIVISLPRTGRYFVCAGAKWTAASLTSTIDLKLSDGTTTISEYQIQEPVATAYMYAKMCGIYNATSAGSKTFSIQSKSSTGAITIAALSTNTSAVEWDIFAIDQALPAPVLVGSVTSNSTGQERTERLTFGGSSVDTFGSAGGLCTSSPCTIWRQSGSWVTSVTRGSTGNYTVNIASGIFSAPPTCNFSANNGVTATGIFPLIQGATATSLTLRTRNAADSADIDAQGWVDCKGPR